MDKTDAATGESPTLRTGIMQIPLPGSAPLTNSPPETGYEGGVGARERLLASAKHMMADVGFERATLEAIAHAAGVAESEVQRNFPDKGLLLEAVFNTAWD